MGLLILAGVAVVAVTIYNRLTAMAGAGTAGLRPFAATRIDLPAGCTVLDSTAVGERLVLRLGDGPRCDRLLVLDPATGALLGQVELIPAP